MEVALGYGAPVAHLAETLGPHVSRLANEGCAGVKNGEE